MTSAAKVELATMQNAVDPRDVLSRVQACLPADCGPVGLHEPRFAGREREYVLDCIDTTWVSYGGAYVGKFEAALAERCGAADAVAVANGTVALQLALELSGLVPGDEVLIPALTFVATANAVVHAGGIPHFVDSEEETLGVDAGRLRQYLGDVGEMRGKELFNRATGRRIAAVMPVHVFGHPVDMDGLIAVANEFNLLVIEDAAEALGSFYRGRPCGSLARVAALSFNGNKLVTTGGGGAIVTSDKALAARARYLTTTAKRPHRWEFVHDEVGYNFRMPNINAALGLAQVEQLDGVLAEKKRLWKRYADVFASMQGARIFADAAYAESNHWLIALILDKADPAMLEGILTLLNDAGLGARPAWRPMHQLAMFADNPRMQLPVAESLASRIVNLPSSAFLAGSAR